MEITEVRVKKMSGEGKIKAYVSVTFDNCFAVHDIRIVEGEDSLFVAMPSHKMREGGFRDYAHPISSEFRSLLQEKILEKYNSEQG